MTLCCAECDRLVSRLEVFSLEFPACPYCDAPLSEYVNPARLTAGVCEPKFMASVAGATYTEGCLTKKQAGA